MSQKEIVEKVLAEVMRPIIPNRRRSPRVRGFGAEGGRGTVSFDLHREEVPDYGRGRGFIPRGQRGMALGRGLRGGIERRGELYKDKAAHEADRQEILKQLPTGLLISIIDLDELVFEKDQKESPKVAGCEYIASYNWVGEDTPTALIPGAPPVWTPPKFPIKPRQDQGDFLVDENAAHYPRHPTEPAVRAVFAMNPEFDTAAIDIFGCASTLGNLNRFARSSDASFRMDVELVGSTLFLVRKERSPRELIQGVYGYGHTFPEACTTWDKAVQGSLTSQRLIKYNFAGLNCVVRFESDGYLKEKLDNEVEKTDLTLRAEEDLSEMMSGTLSMALGNTLPAKGAQLTMKTAGYRIPQDAVFEIKTRTSRKPFDINEELPRLWIRQIPTLILARHNYGLFDDVQVIDIREDIKKWENREQKNLRHFSFVLHRLIQIMKASKNLKVEIRRIGTGPLEIHEQLDGGWSALPSALKDKWVGVLDDDDDNDDDDVDDSYLNF